MAITVKTTGDAVRLTLTGVFNFSMQRAFWEAYAQESPEAAYLLDMGRVTHVDSSALGMLLLLREHAGGEAADISLIDCSPEVQTLLNTAHFQRLFKIHARHGPTRWSGETRGGPSEDRRIR